jgi:hypothetical protein
MLKKPTGIRPITVGEVLRRLASKCLVQQFQEEAVEHLLTYQVGFGVPNAHKMVANMLCWLGQPEHRHTSY